MVTMPSYFGVFLDPLSSHIRRIFGVIHWVCGEGGLVTHMLRTHTPRARDKRVHTPPSRLRDWRARPLTHQAWSRDNTKVVEWLWDVGGVAQPPGIRGPFDEAH